MKTQIKRANRSLNKRDEKTKKSVMTTCCEMVSQDKKNMVVGDMVSQDQGNMVYVVSTKQLSIRAVPLVQYSILLLF